MQAWSIHHLLGILPLDLLLLGLLLQDHPLLDLLQGSLLLQLQVKGVFL